MKKTSIALLLATLFTAAACSPNDAAKTSSNTTATSSPPATTTAAATTAPLAADVMAMVNGKPIPKARERILMEQVQQANPGMEFNADQFKDNLVTQELLSQEALRLGLNKSETYQVQLELITQSILSSALYEDFIKKNPVTDQEIMKEYNAMKEQYTKAQTSAGKKYLARHILVATQEEAQKLLDQLKSGADFVELAKEHSIDAVSGKEGGSLGWSPASNYVGEFAQALEAMDKDKTSTEPVQTQFGWHIIKVDEVRKVDKPVEAFPEINDQIKEQLRKQLGDKKFMDYQQKLIEQADIQLAK